MLNVQLQEVHLILFCELLIEFIVYYSRTGRRLPTGGRTGVHGSRSPRQESRVVLAFSGPVLWGPGALWSRAVSFLSRKYHCDVRVQPLSTRRSGNTGFKVRTVKYLKQEKVGHNSFGHKELDSDDNTGANHIYNGRLMCLKT